MNYALEPQLASSCPVTVGELVTMLQPIDLTMCPAAEPAFQNSVASTAKVVVCSNEGIIYRVSVWLVGNADDAVPISQLPDGVDPEGQSAARPHGAVLHSKIDVPYAAFPEPQSEGQADFYEMAGGFDSASKVLSWTLTSMPPDRAFTFTVEARFLSRKSVRRWTPLMTSGNFTVERIAPLALPEAFHVCDLPTPAYYTLAARTAFGSSGLFAARWPWSIEGPINRVLQNATDVLEVCESTERPSVRDPTGKPLRVCRERPGDRPGGWVRG